MKAIVIEKTDSGQHAEIKSFDVSDLPDGDVSILVDYSTINYKDALAITGASPVVRKWPMIPGIDLAGTVQESSHPRWKQGDRVVLNGWGVGEVHEGGLAQHAYVKGDWLIELPSIFSTRHAMIIGTAGYTAALCVDALIRHSIRPDDGEILVTGASGGVGSIAIALLAEAGYSVVASTGKTSEEAYLKGLGAARVIDRAGLSESGKPLQKELYAGAIDAAGGNTLANVCAQLRYRGAVAACGLAESPKFPTTVMPFILRGVTLYGIDSVMAPIAIRELAWERLARDLKVDILESVATDIALSEALDSAKDVLAGKIRGRLVVDVNK